VVWSSLQRSSVWARTGRGITFATAAAIVAMWAVLVVRQLVDMQGDDLSCIDLLVYRAGGHAIVTGHSLYAADFAAVNHSPHRLAFTYPPFSAVGFVPLALLPVGAAKVLMVVLNAIASATLFTVVAVAVQDKWDRLRGWSALTAPISVKTGLVVSAAAALFTASMPIGENFRYGQINVILAAVVAIDILAPRPPWPRGLLVGLAVAIKLTPLVFVGYFVVTRQWRPVLASFAGVASATALGWLVTPSDTVKYVTSLVFETGRIGGLDYASNQSIRGIVERIPALDGMRGAIWVVATVLVVALATVAIEVSRRRGDTPAAMLSASYIGLICSPVSWGHHWVWLSATVVYLLMRWAATGSIGSLIAGLAVGFVVLAARWTALPNSESRERSWTVLQHLIDSSWALTALALLIWFACTRGPQTTAASGRIRRKADAKLAERPAAG
jgi:alpha-1,2-mannosyltransferase